MGAAGVLEDHLPSAFASTSTMSMLSCLRGHFVLVHPHQISKRCIPLQICGSTRSAHCFLRALTGREAGGEKGGMASMLLERAKPDLFSEDCDAAAPGSSAPPDALAALDEVDDDRYHKSPSPQLLCVLRRKLCVLTMVMRASW